MQPKRRAATTKISGNKYDCKGVCTITLCNAIHLSILYVLNSITIKLCYVFGLRKCLLKILGDSGGEVGVKVCCELYFVSGVSKAAMKSLRVVWSGGVLGGVS